jgi:asparagine synthase (glutamine-hydrolysing)
MGGIAGFAGPGGEADVDAMLGRIAYRGAERSIADGRGARVGVRGDGAAVAGADGSALAWAGSLVDVADPTAVLAARLASGELGDLDGAFAAARWDASARTLTLARDPFGVRSLYYAVVGDACYFASELKQLLAVAALPVALDPVAVHKYLTFSFVPGEATPIAGVRRLLPGHVLTWSAAAGVASRPWFTLTERLEPAAQGAAASALWRLGRDAVGRRLTAGRRAGLYLSGGIDSSAVGLWLRDLGADLTAFTLDFGAASVEREEATQVAGHLGLPLERVAANGRAVADILDDLVWKLDLPFGDAVTGPHYLLGRAAAAAGLGEVWNGEGGDQLFGGWTSKPMVAAAVYGPAYDDATPEQQYLKSYHRFYGLEAELYGPVLAAAVAPGERRRVIAPYLGSDDAHTFLNRVRLTDIALKGSQNILPRAQRMAAGHRLALQVPLFDRRLAEWSFTLPTDLKLHGACEKYVFKLALQGRLPDDIVWRRKYGMSVPITDWVQGPLRPIVDELLGDAALARRGLLQPAFVRGLREGKDVASETRRRRIGERLWALLMLEAWCRRFIDQRGRAP